MGVRVNCPMPSCEQLFDDHGDRRDHLNDVHGIRSTSGFFNCSTSGCGWLFSRAVDRSKHVDEAHKASPQPVGVQAPVAPVIPLAKPEGAAEMGAAHGTYPCDECDRTFPTAQGLGLHKTRAHRGQGHTGAPSKGSTKAKAPRGPSPSPRRRSSRLEDHAPRPPRSPAPSQNGHGAETVTVRMTRAELERLIETIAGQSMAILDATVSDDPAELEREADRLRLLAALKRAVA